MKTARYANASINVKQFVPIGISLGVPKFRLHYELAAFYQTLAPTPTILALTERDAYRTAYRKRLERLGVATIQKGLDAFRIDNKEPLLLCFEDLRLPNLFCHRRFFAEWWEEQTGERVEELEEIGEIKRKGSATSPSLTLFDLSQF